jgi:phosphatidate cytidylyltransferase
MLRWRLIFGILIVAVLIGLCRLDATALVPGVWLMPLMILVTILSTQEMLDLLAKAGIHPMRSLVHAMNILAILSPWWVWNHRCRSHAPISLVIVCATFPLIVFFIGEIVRYRQPGGVLANLAGSVFAWVYIGVMLHVAVWFRMTAGIGAVAAWIVVIKMGDTGAYTVGRLMGRHKMAPSISPGKTIEGAIGAFVFSCAGAWAAFRWLIPLDATVNVSLAPWWGWLVFGLLVGGSGMLGDLAESLLKRDVGVKDSSTWLPGFGGVLDMVDSLLLSVPVAWFCWASGMLGQ